MRKKLTKVMLTALCMVVAINSEIVCAQEIISEEMTASEYELISGDEETEKEEYETEVSIDLLGKMAIATKDEPSTGGFVTRMYKVVLGREPDQGGYEHWVAGLNSGKMSASDIVVSFVFSKEYQAKKKSNGEIVEDLYVAMLNRRPDSSGYEHWLSKLTVGMTPRAIIKGFVGSKEFGDLCSKYGIKPGNVTLTSARDKNYEITYFVYRLYRNCLGRQPDEGGQENWCEKLLAGRSGAEVAYGFVFSKEYLGKHTENEEFTEMLYKTILGRNSDAAGKRNWVEQLNFHHTREFVFNGFLFSNEFRSQCSRAGISVGNKISEPDAGTAWQYNVEILRLCNEQRAANGLNPLVTREDLWKDVAMVRVVELPQLFSHTRPNGTNYTTAYEEAGMECYYSGENIAKGYPSPQAVVDGWMNSPGHRANILRDFRLLATGFCNSDGGWGNYYCQNFMDW